MAHASQSSAGAWGAATRSSSQSQNRRWPEIINYGHLVTDRKTISSIRPPILGNFGALDRGIPPADVNAFDAALKSDGKSSDIKVYDGAGHAFMNPNNKEGYVKAAAADAWKRIDAFLRQRLRRS